MKYPIIKQHDETDCAAACLAMVAKYYGTERSLAEFRELVKVDKNGANIYGIVEGAKKLEFNSSGLEGNLRDMMSAIKDGTIQFPFIAHIVTNQQFMHFVVVYGIDKDNRFIIGNPSGTIEKYTKEKFNEIWTGYIVNLYPGSKFKKDDKQNCRRAILGYFKYLKGKEVLLVIAILMSLFISFADIIGSSLFNYIIDNVYLNTEVTTESGAVWYQIWISKLLCDWTKGFETREKLIFLCGTIILFYIFQIVIMIISNYMKAIVNKKVDVAINNDYFSHIMKMSISDFKRKKTGEMISRFYDVADIKESIIGITLSLIIDTIMMIMFSVFLCNMSKTLFSLVLVIVLLYLVLVICFKDRIKKVATNTMEQEALVTSFFKESIDGIETVKVYGYENIMYEKFKNQYLKLANLNLKCSFINTIQGALISGVTSIGTVIVLGVGTFLVTQNMISLGTLIAFSVMINYFISPIQDIVHIIIFLQMGEVSAGRLNDIMEIKEEKQNVENENIESDITIKNVDFRYGNQELVLKNINIKIEKDSIIGIIGKSGCGKSTLAKLLLAFEKAETGEILFGEQKIEECSLKVLREKVVYLSQEEYIFSGTILENILMGNQNAAKEDIIYVCQISGVAEFVKQLSMGYDTVLEEKGSNLSSGQLQRIAIARALLRKPEVLIMDEATNKLDAEVEGNIMNGIKKYMKGKTIIIITHRLSILEQCKKIYFLKEGEVVEKGTHKELLTYNGEYTKLYKQNEACSV